MGKGIKAKNGPKDGEDKKRPAAEESSGQDNKRKKLAHDNSDKPKEATHSGNIKDERNKAKKREKRLVGLGQSA